MKRAWIGATCVLIALGAWQSWSQRAVHRADGVVAPDDPVQAGFTPTPARVAMGAFTLSPLADFKLTARVLSRDDYRFDAGSAISPMDLAVGWGRMSDSAVLRGLDIDQRDRYYFWRAKALPIPVREIETHSANMHLIPADRSTQHEIERVRAGDVVSFDGYLVRADAADGSAWISSLTRSDSGAGACELVWVENFSIARRP